jgi:hypothetical protein
VNDGGLRSLQDFSKNFRDHPGRGAFGSREVLMGWNFCGFGWEVFQLKEECSPRQAERRGCGADVWSEEEVRGGFQPREKRGRGAEWVPARLKNSCKAFGGVSLSE